jgi:hypothetical protein
MKNFIEVTDANRGDLVSINVAYIAGISHHETGGGCAIYNL